MKKAEVYKQFTVPRRCYPRYDYLSKYANQHYTNFRDILESLDVADDFSQPPFGDVAVVAISTDRKNCLNASDVALKYHEAVSDKTWKVEEFKRIFDSKKTRDSLIVIVPQHYKKLPPGLGHCTFLVEEAKYEVPSVRKKRKVSEKFIVSRTDLAKTISNTLELQVLSGVDDRLAILKWIMELDTTDYDLGSKSVECLTKTTIKESTKHYKPKRGLSNGNINRAATCSAIRQQHTYVRTRSNCNRVSSSSGILEKKDHAKPKTRSVNASRRLSQIQNQVLQCSSDKLTKTKEAAEQLYGEMKGMLYRSGIPLSDFKYADVDMIKILDESSAKEILSISGVMRVGYKFRTLNIYISDSLDLKDRKKCEEEIQSILRKRRITKYAFFYESRQIKMFREVGAEIRSVARGTLGGFAQFGQSRDLCILLAGHLAGQNKNISVRIETEPPRWKRFATVIQPQTENLPEQGNIDIAIAKVMSSERQNCMTRFKDENGNHLPSIMNHFPMQTEENEWLSGLLVHIWGAASKPGLGKIIIPELYNEEGMPPTLAIEDINAESDQEEQRFAKAGDSGAVVCANDIDGEHVHAIAMLMGSPCRQGDDGRLREVNYAAFKLKGGLQFLETRHNGPINLF